ncbi:SMI1/KNR4 family protein [Candidatus Odyssella thessalonicensis]|uniref:SMI1/KNR4 family protein n=1 Tax=Candidatus Odyssella thessalonicensis TaxID=84647 RepID=UPI000225BFC6|nr:SMI1/KNR4 family protein [Candidatus Odyssella thessalonicensis]
MDNTYEYLKKYNWQNYGKSIVRIGRDNIFYDCSLEEIQRAEEQLGRNFPSELRSFYLSIGYGHLTTKSGEQEDAIFPNSNEILPPHIAVDYMQGIIEHPEEDPYYMSPDTYEDLEPGDLPFFEIGDGSSFMVMKLNSKNPNAVWSDCGVKIEDSFERFIWRLYYEDPSFYGPIIEAYYAKK